MRVALDTSRYEDLSRGAPDVLDVIRTVDRVFLPVIVLGELRAGFAYGTKAVENERALQRFLANPRVDVLPCDDATTHHYARVAAQLRRQGTPIPLNDIWIAAVVLQHGLTLYTRDAHFDHLPQLDRI
jgi:tRNA(fMet)-specific endonuclease VapC